LTSIPMTGAPQERADASFRPAPPHVAVQILSLLLFGGFAIVATVLAFVTFWAAGFVLAIVFAWFGFGSSRHPMPSLQRLVPFRPTENQPSPDRTGNLSFDTYRTNVLARLENEQTSFVAFLDRLRSSKDKAQFDRFMEDRARTNQAADTFAATVARPAEGPRPDEY
jgi:Protein of unknown function (DUF2852)